MADTKKTVTDLNAGWYNEVTQAMGITDPNFQLAQGALGLQTDDSSGLFLMADSVPKPANVAYYDPSGLSKRSSAYKQLLGALLPETGTDLRGVLGDLYANWIAFKNSFFDKNPDSDKTQEKLFEMWANRQLDPRKAGQAINTFKQASNDLLNQALDAVHAAGSTQAFVDGAQKPYSLYKYSGTHDAAIRAASLGSATIDFDSSSMDTSLNHTTVNGTASGFYDIFSASASGSFDQLNTKAASERITIKGTINNYGTMRTDPIGWFESTEFTRAYAAKNNNNIWDPVANSGDWDSFFGQPHGSLARKVSELVLVNGYSITVTSYAKYDQADLTKIQTEASFGVWPFFSAKASATHETKFGLDSESRLTVTHTLNPGKIQIWGVIIRDAPE
jgi:hypothetical protein